MWLPDLTGLTGPKYLAISSALRRDLERGVLRTGDRLPPQRELAQALGIDVGTITRAFAEAQRLGLISADGRRGSTVRGASAAAEIDQIAPHDTGMNLPPIPQDSSLPACLVDITREILLSPAAANRLQYQPTGGAIEDRKAAAEWLELRGIEASADTVLVVSGAQCALHAIAHSALDSGDTVCTGHSVYPGWLAVARRRGIRVLPVDSDAAGIQPEALDRACAEGQVRAIYLVPGNDNPTTATMDVQRRADIVGVARRHDLVIIEDDAYGWLAEQPLPPLGMLAPERTWHVASLSKIISPALRVAYVRAPAIRDILRLATDVHETTIMAPSLNVAASTHWLRSGTWARLVAEVRAECLARQALVRNWLPEGSYRASREGYHLWVPLTGQATSAELVAALATSGMSVVAGEAFAAGRPELSSGARISIGGSLTRDGLTRSLQLLDAVLHHRGDRALPMV